MSQETPSAGAEKSRMTSRPRAAPEGYVYPFRLPLWLYLEFNMRESVNLLPLLCDTSHRWIHTPVTNPVPHREHALYYLDFFFFFFHSVTESIFMTSNFICFRATRSEFCSKAKVLRNVYLRVVPQITKRLFSHLFFKLAVSFTTLLGGMWCGCHICYQTKKIAGFSCDCQSLESSHMMIQHKATGSFSACSHMQACE